MNMKDEIYMYFNDLMSSAWQWDLIALNLLLSTLLIFVFKFQIGYSHSVSVHDEIAEKDNPAFGITLGMSFLSFFLIMSAASTGNDRVSYTEEIVLMISYGLAGMLMLAISKVIFDKISMKNFCLQEEIRKRNIAASIVEGSNILATALIVFTYMGWVKGVQLETILVVVYGWFVSQLLLSLVSFIRAKIYRNKDGSSLQDAIKNDNIAVAIRYSAYKLSFALTPLIASVNYLFEEGRGLLVATEIFVSAILLSIIITLLTAVIKHVVIPKVDFGDEINSQRNIGMAVIEASIVLGITYLCFGLLK